MNLLHRYLRKKFVLPVDETLRKPPRYIWHRGVDGGGDGFPASGELPSPHFV